MLAVVLSFDQFPVRALGCYGNSMNAMSCLNRIAAESVVFDQHFGEDFSPMPDGHAWWSGCYHFPRKGSDLLTRIPSLSDQLNQTNVVMRWLTDDAHPEVVPLPKSTDITVVPSFSDLIGRGCEWLSEARNSPEVPRFLWLKAGGKSWDGFSLGGWDSEQNDTALGHLDKIIEPFWREVSEWAHTGKVLFVLTAARGQSLGERATPPTADSTWAEEYVHLPLVIHHSESPGGERRLEMTQPMEIPATLLDFFACPNSPKREGSSILPSVLGEGETRREFVTSGCHGVWESLRTQNFYGVRMADPDYPESPRWRLFMKPDDVWDWQNVSNQEPEMTETLSQHLDAFLATARNQVPVDFSLADFTANRRRLSE